ncbi:unnamed protein product [Clonostachys byssicola]|uniref:Leucine-rich repeat domain-containing protein n=1 Tax=Clonostachys byssicola TaxID=160290 RepID=A0A9N9U1B6_9HYPO|nr:unnamed protein product [Clonostachys byssicola]
MDRIQSAALSPHISPSASIKEQQGQVRSNRTTLLTLPPELQTKIFLHLAVSWGKSTIQEVLRTCKQLYEVALPISVSIFRNTINQTEGQGPCSTTRNIQFLRYILVSKPWLAKDVRTVVFGRISSRDGEGNDKEERPSQASITEEETAIYQQHIEFILGQLPSGYTERWTAEWVEDLKSGTSDAQAALILLACPNIHTLLYEMPDQPRHFTHLLSLVHNLTEINASIRTHDHSKMIIPLSNLQDVFHETMDYKHGYSEFGMEAPEFFTFPRLRYYECILAHVWSNVEGRFERLPRASSSVEEIILHASYINKDTLDGMLGACKALRKFEFTHFPLNRELGTPCLMMPRDVMDAILPHASTFESLYLNMEETWDKEWKWVGCPERLYMGMGLRQMCMLKRLEIGMQALTGMLVCDPDTPNPPAPNMPVRVKGAPKIADCLPESLECLKIYECGMPILDQAAELIRVIEQGHGFMRLTYIGLLFNGWKMDPDKDFPQVRKLTCNASHVRLDISFREELLYLCELGETVRLPDDDQRNRNITSRIYAPHIRKRYREVRGQPDFWLWCDADM